MIKPQDTHRTWMALRMPYALAISFLAIIPFLFTALPPLTDVSGHIGRFSVQTAPTSDPIFRFFSFHWSLTLNLASDLLVEALHPFADVIPATWTLCAATAVLTTLGLLMTARMTRARGAYALPWASLFVFNFPFLWGFLNYSLTIALVLLAFAGWIALDRHRRCRAALFLIITPVLLVGHGVAGVVGVGLITAYTMGETLSKPERPLLNRMALGLGRAWPPIAAAVVTLCIWKAFGASDKGRTLWLFARKREAILMMLRDQHKIFDIASVGACLLVGLIGQWWGARLKAGPTLAVLFVAILFFATPSLISGSDRIDTRLAPLIPILFFAMQDWSNVGPRRRYGVLIAGLLLLGARFAVTTASFANYGKRYSIELSALDNVPHGARVLNLSKVYCDKLAWRSQRLEHLANLATTLRGAWVNAHWSIEGLQLLQVRYQPSPEYARDPSQLIWPAECIDFKESYDDTERHTLSESMLHIPLNKVDFLWIIGERLPVEKRDDRLVPVWHDDISELYRVRATPENPRTEHS